MRTKLSLLAAVAAFGGAALVTLTAGSASAINCPGGTHVEYVEVGHLTHTGVCVPDTYPQCDPGPCDATAAPPQN
jgi:hypothetical protein